jgi:hypothetical protein
MNHAFDVMTKAIDINPQVLKFFNGEKILLVQNLNFSKE